MIIGCVRCLGVFGPSPFLSQPGSWSCFLNKCHDVPCCYTTNSKLQIKSGLDAIHIEWHECQNKQWQIYGRTQIPRNRQSERCYVAVLVLVIAMRKVVVQNGCTQANLQWKIRITNLSYDPHLLSLQAPLLAHYKSSSMTSRGRWRSPSEVSSSKARSSSRSCSRRSTVKSESGKASMAVDFFPMNLAPN